MLASYEGRSGHPVGNHVVPCSMLLEKQALLVTLHLCHNASQASLWVSVAEVVDFPQQPLWVLSRLLRRKRARVIQILLLAPK